MGTSGTAGKENGLGVKLYVVIWKDHHTDTGAFVFSTAEKAIEFAKAKAREYARHGDLTEENIKGWLYYGRYSCEGDSLHVIERELDAP